jgi:ferredoxin--NADP+ reductase
MTATATAPVPTGAPVKEAPFHVEKVLWVKHWTDRLFSFAITRPASFRFRSGEFVMIGLPAREELGEKKPILRAYSIGLAALRRGAGVLLDQGPRRPADLAPAADPGRRRHPAGQEADRHPGPGRRPPRQAPVPVRHRHGPGALAVRGPRPRRLCRFEQVIVAHGVREVQELAYRDLFTSEIHDDPLVGDEAKAQLTYYPTVTREPFERQGRFTDLIESGKLFADLGLEQVKFDPEHDRAMLCGSMAMIKDTAALLEAHGLKEGSNAEPGDFVIERAFVG